MGAPTDSRDNPKTAADHGPDPAPTAGETAERLLWNEVRLQYACVAFLAAHLTDGFRAFGGDHQRQMILAVLGQRSLP
jgi:hypothetical protein